MQLNRTVVKMFIFMLGSASLLLWAGGQTSIASSLPQSLPGLAPELLQMLPPAGQNDVPVHTDIVLDYSEPVSVSNGSSFEIGEPYELYCPAEEPIAFTLDGDGTTTHTLKPDEPLPNDTLCDFYIQTDLIFDDEEDTLSGTPVDGSATLPPASLHYTFTTALNSPPSTIQPSVGKLEFTVQKGSPKPVSKTIRFTKASTLYKDLLGVSADKVKLSNIRCIGEDILVDVTFDASQLAPGQYKDPNQYYVDLQLTDGTQIKVPLEVDVVDLGKLTVSRTELSFGATAGATGAALPAKQALKIGFNGSGSTNWTATAAQNWVTLSAASGQATAAAPATLDISIAASKVAQAGTDSTQVTISDGSNMLTVNVNLNVTAQAATGVELFGLEVTQGIQNLRNEIPLIAGRATFVRAHVRSTTGQAIDNASAELVALRNGTEIGRAPLANKGGPIRIQTDPKREQLNDSFLFEVPAAWRTGAVTLKVEGKSTPLSCREQVGTANDCQVSADFTAVPKFPIKFILGNDSSQVRDINGNNSNFNWSATRQDAVETVKWLQMLLPLNEIDWSIHNTPFTYGELRDGKAASGKSDDLEILNKMTEIWTNEGRPRTHYYGLFTKYGLDSNNDGQVDKFPTSGSGIAYVGSSVAAPRTGMGDHFRGQNSSLNPHEIGHNLGRGHSPCGVPNADPAYPHTGALISGVATGEQAYFGFNIFTQEVYPPTHKDLMSYCFDKWISDYTYRGALAGLKLLHTTAVQASTTDLAIDLVAQAGEDVLLVSGRIEGSEGTIDSVRQDVAEANISAPEGDRYTLVLSDDSGNELARHPFIAAPVSGHRNWAISMEEDPESEVIPSHEDETALPFVLAVEKPAGLAHMALMQGTTLLDERSVSANAPTVAVTAPAADAAFADEAVTITWTAADIDNDDADSLSFDVAYSNDNGATWSALAIGIAENQLVVDSLELPGGTQAKVRVTVSDGFLSASDESDVFSVADKGPAAVIIHDENDKLYVEDQSIHLTGLGYDTEDGFLSNLTWYSDRDGQLGSGGTLDLNADNLAEGRHVITLEAMDSQRQRSRATAANVCKTTQNNSAPNPKDVLVLNILRQRQSTPVALSVAPQKLAFTAAAGSNAVVTTTLSIRNQSTGAINWAASASDGKIGFGANNGSTPSELFVSANTNGLAIGFYQGTVTLVGNSAADTVAVPYVINIVDKATLQRINGNQTFMPFVMR